MAMSDSAEEKGLITVMPVENNVDYLKFLDNLGCGKLGTKK
jgi:hypothetical protein